MCCNFPRHNYTIVHDDATLEQLQNQLKDYDSDVEHLIIFHKDEFDYSY